MIFIGTAGFNYADWKGHFYPKAIKAGEMLEFYAARFPVVEINSTWHALPRPENILSMARRTPTGFQFIVKAFQGLTHAAEVEDETFTQFLESIRPLEDHGKLACILAQFPWGFRENEANRDFLRRFRERMPGRDIVVEFRNEGWIKEETTRLLEELELGFCCVDEPRLKGLVRPHVIRTSPIGYIRFNGRNYETWWDRSRRSWERYDYLYSEEEPQEWMPGIMSLQAQTEKIYLIFNNHYRSKSARNAAMMMSMLPPEIVAAVDEEPVEDTLF